MAQYQILLRATLRGHTDCVTAIAPIDNFFEIITASRDQSIIQWSLTKTASAYGIPRCDLTGHSQSVEDVDITFDGEFVISGGCDGELRLWDLKDAETVQTYVGHTADVLSVAFSPDNRLIVSASRDKTIKLWNVLGVCKHTIEDAHTDRVTCLRFVPRSPHHTVVSGSWDKTVKIWDLSDCKLRSTLIGHTGYVNAVSVSPDGSLCASGGQDGQILLWDVGEGKRLLSFDAGSVTHALCFSASRYWICVATEAGIKVWDLENKYTVADLKVDLKQEREMGGEEGVGDAELEEKEKGIYCTSLCWSADGDTLFSGYTDGVVRVWGVVDCGLAKSTPDIQNFSSEVWGLNLACDTSGN